MWSFLLSLSSPLIAWIMKQAGLRDEEIQTYISMVSNIQSGVKSEVTGPQKDAEESRQRLRETENSSKPPS